SQLETSIDYHSEYLADARMTKSFLNIKIQPGLDRFYEIGIVDDPRGVVDTKRIERNGNINDDYTETITYENKIKFTALFAKNFYDFTVKGGLIESAGGIGVDYYMHRRDLRLSVEAFDFDDLVL